MRDDRPLADSGVIKTTCPYCGTGCGVDVRREIDRVTVAGDNAHPANFGRLCVKGSALGETVVPQGRLLYPQFQEPGSDPRVSSMRVSWNTALDRVAEGFARIIREHGPDAVAWYVSGQLLTEDYYVANKLVKGYVGTANIDTNSRLCMSSAVAGHKRAFGEDIVPVSYDDLEQADLVVLVGSNTAWCHPIIYQRIVRAREHRPAMKLVVIDPRRTTTAETADLHLPLRAGSDVRLFNGLLAFLHAQQLGDQDFIAQYTRDLDQALAAAQDSASDGDGDLANIAQQCGLELDTLLAFYRLFAANEKVITAFSMGVNQSSSGTDKVNAIINCHLFTGRIGTPGAGPFSITGQPNAMGGREVGGLANMLAAHMDLENGAHRGIVQQFWNSPRIAARPGLKAVDLFQAVADGRVKAIWIMATNPVVSMPDADAVKRALQGCELVVVSDVIAQTDTTPYAHVLLPAQGWGEKDGTVTNSERCISRQRAFVAAAGEARPDWWMLSEVARRLGYGEHFAYAGPHEIFDEHARLTAFRNHEATARRYLNLEGLTGMSRAEYDALQPIRWPVTPQAAPSKPHPYINHPDGRARFIATPPQAPLNAVGDQYPLVLNTGRVRDQWHTMTRTGLAPKLGAHTPEPYIDMHPQDAADAGVSEHGLARAQTHWGSMVARLRISGEMSRGNIFVPIHWNNQFASDARVGALVNPVVDPISGEPEFKHTPVRVEAFEVRWHGFVLSRRSLPMRKVAWWTRITGERFTRYEMAGRQSVDDWAPLARSALGAEAEDCDWLQYEDRGARSYRAAHVIDDRIESCLFIAAHPDLPSRTWLASLFLKDSLTEIDRVGLLAGAPPDRGADTGPTICSCFGVGQNQVLAAIRDHGCRTPEALGARLRCGTNCGSCIPELRRLIAATPAAIATPA